MICVTRRWHWVRLRATGSVSAISTLFHDSAMLTCSVDDPAGMIVSLVSPYLQQDPVNMGGKIGFIWGGVSAITLAWVFWFVPELKVSRARDPGVSQSDALI